MEIEKPEITRSLNTDGKGSGRLRTGQLLRVRIIKALARGYSQVELRGRIVSARLSGNIPSSLFIARVMKTAPQIELKFIRSLKNKGNTHTQNSISSLLYRKKQFIQNLFTTDNFFGILLVSVYRNKKRLKENIINVIKNQNINKILQKSVDVSKEVREYFVLQNLFNYLSEDASAFLFPFLIDERWHLCDGKILRGRDSSELSLFLNISLESGDKIHFLVFLDFDVIVCTVSTDNSDLEKRLRNEAQILAQRLKSQDFHRNVEIHFTPYRERDYENIKKIKKIDIRM
jgi:hypothetical protein